MGNCCIPCDLIFNGVDTVLIRELQELLFVDIKYLYH